MVASPKTHCKILAFKKMLSFDFFKLKNPLLMLMASFYVHKMVEIHDKRTLNYIIYNYLKVFKFLDKVYSKIA